MTPAPLLSPKELASFLGVPITTVYRWNYAGDGPKRYRIGKHVRYDLNEVEAWLQSQSTGQSVAS